MNECYGARVTGVDWGYRLLFPCNLGNNKVNHSVHLQETQITQMYVPSLGFIKGKRCFKAEGTACYHCHIHAKKCSGHYGQSVWLCVGGSRGHHFPSCWHKKVDQCMFFSLFTHLPTYHHHPFHLLHTQTHTHWGCKSSEQGTQGPLWTQQVGSLPRNISPQLHSS